MSKSKSNSKTITYVSSIQLSRDPANTTVLENLGFVPPGSPKRVSAEASIHLNESIGKRLFDLVPEKYCEVDLLEAVASSENFTLAELLYIALEGIKKFMELGEILRTLDEAEGPMADLLRKQFNEARSKAIESMSK